MRFQALVVTAVLLSASSPVMAGPISGLYVFGDSLSDNGNLSAIAAVATGGAVVVPAPPYAPGRASNGPVAVEYLAGALGLGPLVPAALGGTNYAVIGAATGEVPFPVPGDPSNTADNVAELLGLALPVPTGLLNGQLPVFLSTLPAIGPIDPDALFVLWGGPNDLAISPSLATAEAAADNIAAALDTLYLAGARRFLVPAMPDLGLTPGAPDPTAALSVLSSAFNAQLRDNLTARQSLAGIGIASFDTAAFFQAAVSGGLGFSNVTDPCVAGNVLASIRLCAIEDEAGYLFWDASHPTTEAHRLLGGEFANAAGELVAAPEPLSLTLVGLGVAVALRRARRAA